MFLFVWCKVHLIILKSYKQIMQKKAIKERIQRLKVLIDKWKTYKYQNDMNLQNWN